MSLKHILFVPILLYLFLLTSTVLSTILLYFVLFFHKYFLFSLS
jgi:hypothetical protein